jgi:hypothetical protein
VKNQGPKVSDSQPPLTRPALQSGVQVVVTVVDSVVVTVTVPPVTEVTVTVTVEGGSQRVISDVTVTSTVEGGRVISDVIVTSIVISDVTAA